VATSFAYPERLLAMNLHLDQDEVLGVLAMVLALVDLRLS
jgi:hypothetical protein